jgi:polysaccharide deacetylase 2 family uncharacterized protein YibQ
MRSDKELMDKELIEQAIQKELRKAEKRLRQRARVMLCAHCKRKFVAFQANQRFCSLNCRVLANYYKKRLPPSR